MKRTIVNMKTLFVMTLLVLGSSAAHAQTTISALQEIISLNEIPAEQNASYQKTSQVLKRDIVDRKNKVIGEVHDVLVQANGSIDSLYVDFDEVGFDQLVYLDYQGMAVRSSSASYNLTFSDHQIELIYPEILANTAVAAGDDADTYSVTSLIGGPVRSNSGEKVGVVDTVLFNSTGTMAVAVLIKGEDGKFALPFTAIEKVQSSRFDSASRMFVADVYATALDTFYQTN